LIPEREPHIPQNVMQQNFRRSLIAVLTLGPLVAAAHPGHSAFDPAILPHSGHEGEYVGVLCGVIGLLVRGIRTRRNLGQWTLTAGATYYNFGDPGDGADSVKEDNSNDVVFNGGLKVAF